MSVNGNQMAGWLAQHGWAILIALLMLAGTFAVNLDRTSNGEARDNALSARLNSQEQTIGDLRERVLRVEINDKTQDSKLAGQDAAMEARAKASDEQIATQSERIRNLEVSDRENAVWRSSLTEKLTNMTEKLERLGDLIEQRMAPEPHPAAGGRNR